MRCLVSNKTDALLSCLDTDLAVFYTAPDSVRGFAASYLRSSLVKKLMEDKDATADDKAFELFALSNKRCGEWSGSWPFYMDELMGLVKDEIYRFWNPRGYPLVSSFNEILDEARHGPGTSVGIQSTDFYTKSFSSCFTSTKQCLYDAYIRYVETFQFWYEAESNRSTTHGSVNIVKGSRLAFVPKRTDISRTINVEPSLNQFYQLGFGRLLERRLGSYFGINLSTQPDVNRELARVGSIGGSHATIDLSSASDSVSLKMLEEFLPRDFVSWLKLLRSPIVTLPDGNELELHMVSSMGNGFTFPLQTIVFSSVVCAALRYRGLVKDRHASASTWTVFGDDIIVPNAIVRDVLSILGYLGFSVNADKTFIEGPFRESCGHDYYNGNNVRPVFIKSLKTDQDLFVAINLLNEWSARHGINLPETIGLLRRWCRGYVPYVPPGANVDSGIRVPLDVLTRKKHDRNGSVLYKRFIANTPSVVIDGEKFLKPRRHRSTYSYNPSGLLLCVIGGYIRQGRIGIRLLGPNSYRLRRDVTPSWDYVEPVNSIALLVWQRWKTAVYTNLYV
jgi:hypothetical protein